jgi:hypothetical protein
MIIGCRPTIIRSVRWRRSRTARRRPTWAWRCSPISAAYDFGYITAGELVERTANALKTMHELERYQGHFYNWYDTLSLAPLPPRYVSSVDSGNLAGSSADVAPRTLRAPG